MAIFPGAVAERTSPVITPGPDVMAKVPPVRFAVNGLFSVRHMAVLLLVIVTEGKGLITTLTL